jgi:tRNA(Arg) A34 adenosine deaminase TadA
MRLSRYCTRRSTLAVLAAAGAAVVTRARAAPAEHREFIAAAFKMKDEAVRAGDQAYGAVVVKDGRIIGFGPSRVVLKKDWTAHAEREAIREAQARLGRTDLSSCILYSSSRPCSECERAAADAHIERMIFGSEATDVGRPRKS